MSIYDQLCAVWRRVPKKFRLQIHRPLPVRLQSIVDGWRPGAGLVLIGSTGSLKSTLMAHLVRRLCKEAMTNVETRWLVFGLCWVRASEVTIAGRGDNQGDADLIHRATSARLLVLDDFAEPSKTLHRLLEQRYDRGLVTLITSGALSKTELAERLGGEAVYRWVTQSGKRNGRVINLDTYEGSTPLDACDSPGPECYGSETRQNKCV